MKTTHSITALFITLLGGATHFISAAEPSAPAFRPVIPRIYDDAETATWQVPLASAKVSPSFLTSSYFYARKVWPRDGIMGLVMVVIPISPKCSMSAQPRWDVSMFNI